MDDCHKSRVESSRVVSRCDTLTAAKQIVFFSEIIHNIINFYQELPIFLHTYSVFQLTTVRYLKF